MPVYARKLVLRTCGRFSVVASDFGADYRTHTHVTGEALHASLTRGVTWLPGPILIRQDSYDFHRDYDVSQRPVWFTPGLFHSDLGGYRLSASELDSTRFNAVHELYPTTGASYGFDRRTSSLKLVNRPAHVPTYGTWQSILPNRQILTCGFSADRRLLDYFEVGQTYLLGKKRTMVQITELSSVAEASEDFGMCHTPFIQLPPDGAKHFASFEVAAVTLRYILIRGQTREATRCWKFSWESGEPVALPAFYVESVLPLG